MFEGDRVKWNGKGYRERNMQNIPSVIICKSFNLTSESRNFRQMFQILQIKSCLLKVVVRRKLSQTQFSCYQVGYNENFTKLYNFFAKKGRKSKLLIR